MTPRSDFAVTCTADGRTTTVALPEQALVESHLETTRAELTAIAANGAGATVHLDFRRIDFLGSSALGLLVTLHRRLADNGGQLVLENLAPHLLDLFQLTRLDTVLTVRPAQAPPP